MKRISQQNFIRIARKTIENSLRTGRCAYWGTFHQDENTKSRCLLYEQKRPNREHYIPIRLLEKTCENSLNVYECKIEGKTPTNLNGKSKYQLGQDD